MVADEPTTALDVTVQAQILDLMRSLRDQTEHGFLLITHDLGVAAEVADRIAVLYAGRLAEVGPAGEMYWPPPATPTAAACCGPASSLQTDRDRPGHHAAASRPTRRAAAGCPFGPRCTHHRDECDAVLPELASRPDGSPGRQWRASGVDSIEPELGRRRRPVEPWVCLRRRRVTPGTAAIIKDLHKSFEIGTRRSQPEAARPARGGPGADRGRGGGPGGGERVREVHPAALRRRPACRSTPASSSSARAAGPRWSSRTPAPRSPRG